MRDDDFLLEQVEIAIRERRKTKRSEHCDMCALRDSGRMAGLCYSCRRKYKVEDEQIN